MQPIRIGNFEVNRIADYQGPFFDPPDFFPDFDPEVVRANTALLGPRLLEPGTGKLIFSFHSFVVRTGHHTILIDSCIGNDKERPTRPQFHRMKSSFIDDLGGLGVKPEEVDFVMMSAGTRGSRTAAGSPPSPTPNTSWPSANTTIGRISI